MERKRYKCPSCGEMTAVPILGGYPTEEAWALVEAGDLILGGCCRLIDDPDRACTSCHFHWNSESGNGQIVLPEEDEEDEGDAP
jgi:DNA primase large subunit